MEIGSVRKDFLKVHKLLNVKVCAFYVSSYYHNHVFFFLLVFVIFSLRKGKKEKEILNPMVIEEIKKEFAL